MEALYLQTNNLVQDTQDLFRRLENDPVNSIVIENEIQQKIDLISSNCDRLDILAFKVPINNRSMAKMRCDQLKYDNRHIQAALSNYQTRRQKREQERIEREQLLSRRFAPGHDDTSITVDYAMRENSSLQNSHRGVDEMLYTGTNILGTLRDNRETLKGAHRRLIDLANTLGLSNATISLIERRVTQDKYVFIGGMAATILVIVIVVVYFV